MQHWVTNCISLAPKSKKVERVANKRSNHQKLTRVLLFTKCCFSILLPPSAYYLLKFVTYSWKCYFRVICPSPIWGLKWIRSGSSKQNQHLGPLIASCNTNQPKLPKPPFFHGWWLVVGETAIWGSPKVNSFIVMEAILTTFAFAKTTAIYHYAQHKSLLFIRWISCRTLIYSIFENNFWHLKMTCEFIFYIFATSNQNRRYNTWDIILKIIFDLTFEILYLACEFIDLQHIQSDWEI